MARELGPTEETTPENNTAQGENPSNFEITSRDWDFIGPNVHRSGANPSIPEGTGGDDGDKLG